MKTIRLQTKYDTKLSSATYDALQAFQMNTVNSDTSDLSNSKLRDIEASVNIFFNSIANNFNMEGYNEDILAEYVPALVYTMYDGYYIYSPYTNTLDGSNSHKWITNNDTGETTELSDAEILSDTYNKEATYKQGDRITGLKPYVFYSCRYQMGSDSNFVITYSLDNYITIQGKIRGNDVFDSGYLLDNITESGNTISYRGVPINANETLKEYIYDAKDNVRKEYTYIKVNGVKYYQDSDDSWFSILNGERYPQGTFTPQTTAAIEYYKEAKEFKERIQQKYKLEDLRSSYAIDEKGQPLVELDENGNRTNISKFGDYQIFDFGDMNGTSIEDPNSNFNQQRLAVIRYSIEKNLSIAIANYNNYSGVTANFQMPKLKEDEWDKIINNVSIISFLQGLNIGGKIYNGYSIVNNNRNQEVVNEDSIYIMTNDNYYHRANDKDLIGNSNITTGALNIDFEIKKGVDNNGENVYVIPKGRRYTKRWYYYCFRMLYKYRKSQQYRSHR